MERLLELRRQLADLVQQAQGIIDTAEGESRALSADESGQYESLRTQMTNLRSRIQRIEEQQDMGQFVGKQMTGRNNPHQLGMSDREAGSYSIVRAMSAAASGDWSNAGLEAEASRAIAGNLSREPNGFFVPFDWMQRDASGNVVETRDMQAGQPSEGGNVVSTDLLSSSFIEILRNALVIRQAGATFLTGLVGNVDIPKQSAAANVSWGGEHDPAEETNPAIDQISLSPKSVSAYTEFTRRILNQASIDIEAFIRNELAMAAALGIDLAALHGSGSGDEPTGIANTTGVSAVLFGGAPTWGKVVQMETAVANSNAALGRLAYVTNTAVRGKLKETEKFSGGGREIWQGGNTPLNGHRAIISNQVRGDLGTGSDKSAMFFGNWSDLMVGQWGGLDLLVDPYTHSLKMKNRVVIFQDVDIQVRREESFAVALDITTS